MKTNSAEFVSKKLKDSIDSLVLQQIRDIIQEIGILDDEVKEVEVKTCPHCKKQYIRYEVPDTEEEAERCVFYLSKSIDDSVVVYRKDKEITYALKSELDIA